MSKIFNYSFSTSEYKKTNIYNDFSLNSPVSGLGYGLPEIENIFEYFGGKIEICSNWPWHRYIYYFKNKRGLRMNTLDNFSLKL